MRKHCSTYAAFEAQRLLTTWNGELFDYAGIFLGRTELRPYWDVAIFLDAEFEVAMERALSRDLGLFGDAVQTRERYTRRYWPGQRLYFQQCRPRERADVLIDKTLRGRC